MGDPLFVCWVLLWTSGQIGRALGGDLSALAQYWSGNIFFPAPLTVADSEHFTPQMLQALPILALTDKVILADNLLLLATFVLSALGTYLLVRDITGWPLAAFFAGLAFAYSPYRLDQYSHLQLLSCQMDTVHALRLAALRRWRASACARRRHRGARHASALVDLLPGLLHPVCRRLLAVRNDQCPASAGPCVRLQPHTCSDTTV